MSMYGTPTHDGLYDLAAIDTELRAADAYAREGHTARTLVRELDVRLVVVVMKAGARMADHRANETATIHVLTGQVRLQLPDRSPELSAGQLLVLEAGVQHEVEAITDCSFLLTLGGRSGAPAT